MPALVVSAALALAEPADAAIMGNTFAPSAALRGGGRAAAVCIVIGCETPGTFAVEVTVRQGETVATGSRHGRCTGEAETSRVVVHTEAGESLEAGTAAACGEATTKTRGRVDNRRSWCRHGGITIQEVAP